MIGTQFFIIHISINLSKNLKKFLLAAMFQNCACLKCLNKNVLEGLFYENSLFMISFKIVQKSNNNRVFICTYISIPTYI